MLRSFKLDQGIGIWGWLGVDETRRRKTRTRVEARYRRESPGPLDNINEHVICSATVRRIAQAAGDMHRASPEWHQVAILAAITELWGCVSRTGGYHRLL